MKKNENTVQQDNKFLGTEKINKLLKMFAIPCVLSLVIQALYNIVDQIFIGNAGYLPFGNTATGIVYPLTVISLAIGLLIGDGIASFISINQGRNNIKDNHKIVGTGITIGLIISLVLMIICFIFTEPILKFFGASGEASIFLLDAKEYSTWIIAGIPFFILACVLNPIVRADGSPKFAMFAMALGAIINIVLDPIFLNILHLGMTGAALATFIGQVITLILHILYLFKLKGFKLSIKSFIPNFKLFLSTIKLGISSFLTQISIVIISIVNNIVLSTYFVSTVQNAQGILNVAFKIFGIVISIAIGIASGSQPILGYNYGAKKYDRVKETLRKVLIITLLIGIIATILFEAFPEYLLSLFGYSISSGNSSIEINFGIDAFRIYLGFIAFTCLIKAISIFFQAIGKPVKATIIAILRDVIFIVPLAILLPMISNKAFMFSAPISDFLTAVIAFIMLFNSLKKMSINVKEKEENVFIKPSKSGIIITISREHGAGGKEIGRIIAQKLNIPFYDKEIAMLGAKESGLATEFIDNIENDTANNLFYELYLSTQVNQTAICAQEKILKQIAEKGSCVIVGRAADYVLNDFHPFKIFIYANEDFKINRIMQIYNDNRKKAKENIHKSNNQRAKFYKSITGNEWANKENFDLYIDSSSGIENSVNKILNYLEKSSLI